MVGLTTDAKRVHQLNGEKLEAIEWETRKPAVAGRNQREYVSEMGYLAQRELNRRARRRESGEGPCDGEGRIGGTVAAAGRPPCQGM